MLFHHDARPYEVAATDAAKKARDKIEGMIEAGRQSAARTIEKVMTEIPKDQMVKAPALEFFPNERRLGVQILDRANPSLTMAPLHVHDHALGQLCERTNMNLRYAKWLQDPEDKRSDWGTPLLAHNLNELTKHMDGKRMLLRSYDQTLRGVLSDKYRRLDSRPLVESFATAVQAHGAIPIQGYASDTKVALKALLPQIFEPVPNEVVAFGVCWENSDYGNGAHQISGFVLRLWCTNYAISEEGMRQVHLGKRLGDNIQYSARTYELDTQATASALKDTVAAALGAETTTGFCEVIKSAHENKIDPRTAISAYRKSLSKDEAQQVTEAFNSPDVENMPPGNSLWRLSNAFSWVAGKTENEERKLDMMKIAGQVIGLSKVA
jgi:hypothetical protein